jgi:biotin carboxyl carrier protein
MKYRLRYAGREFEATVLERASQSITFEITGQQYVVEIESAEKMPLQASEQFQARSPQPRPKTIGTNKGGSGEIKAQMPGIVVQVIVKEGSVVQAGDPLLVIEAMKMENSITAPIAGTVQRVAVEPGKQVNSGELLISIVP